MKRLISNVVAWFVIYICLRNIDESHANTYHAEEDMNEVKHWYTKSVQNVQSKISCAISCARDPDSCKAWYYNRQEETCRIQTDETETHKLKEISCGPKPWKQWRLVNPISRGNCRVPFVNNVTAAAGPITKYDGTVACNRDFCFFEQAQADQCRLTGRQMTECGSCRQIEWRRMNQGTLCKFPVSITTGWKLIWKGKMKSRTPSFTLSLNECNSCLKIIINGETTTFLYQKLRRSSEFKGQLNSFEIKISVGLKHFLITVRGKTMKMEHEMQFSQLSTQTTYVAITGYAYTESLKLVY
ncbi:uncharacterized protein LOC121387836 [Gigantopelta aegis]|uniref:uncharacterized protein LOC121387836 n=1 Tax=Gigantopelta aegis TaxID=1735272 RepID=UPI001B888B73|nr:uncharacterized protein LOC121387836 [Gigantopelta aegis]